MTAQMQRPRNKNNTEVRRLISSAVNRHQKLSKVTKIRPYDILCGRDRAAFNNVGNRRFRVTINLNLPRYVQATSKNDKSEMIISLVRFLRNDVGVRFLKKKGKSYFELDEKQARSKVGHALRDMLVAQEEAARKKIEEEEAKKKTSGKRPAAAKGNRDSKKAADGAVTAPLSVEEDSRSETSDRTGGMTADQSATTYHDSDGDDDDDDDDHSFYTPPPLSSRKRAAPVEAVSASAPVPGEHAGTEQYEYHALREKEVLQADGHHELVDDEFLMFAGHHQEQYHLPMPETRAAFFALEDDYHHHGDNNPLMHHPINPTYHNYSPVVHAEEAVGRKLHGDDQHDALVLWEDHPGGVPTEDPLHFDAQQRKRQKTDPADRTL